MSLAVPDRPESNKIKYHMIQQIITQSDVGDLELLYAPIWFAKYDHKGKKIVLVIDANSGRVINSEKRTINAIPAEISFNPMPLAPMPL
jgi:hypothetical protein